MKFILLILLLLITTNSFAQFSSWDESKLKEHWKTNQPDEIEGIYEWVRRTSDGPIYVYGLLKTSSGYNLIFLRMRTGTNYLRLSTGYIKAKLTPTATKDFFTAETSIKPFDTEIKGNSFFKFEGGLMKQIADAGETIFSFIKTYPAYNNIPKSDISTSSGTGFGITSSGIIVTNYHVIANAKRIKIRGVNSDFNNTYNAKVLVSDKNNDLALLQIIDSKFTTLNTIPYVLGLNLRNVGESVFALGYPLREAMGDEIKLTNGIISSKTGFQGDITSYQVSVPVQPGNSGGPLFDSNGNVIGIINAKLSIAENASYAVKISYLMNLIYSLDSPPKLSTVNTLAGKSLATQVRTINKFVYIIETE